MWFELWQRVLNWFGGDKKSSGHDQPVSFRESEPQLQDMTMNDVGSSNLQVGQNNGQVKFVNLKQERNVRVVHQHFYNSQPPQDQRPANPATANKEVIKLTEEQKTVYLELKQLTGEGYETVMVFMEREFKTRLIAKVDGKDLFRVRKYVAKMLEVQKNMRTPA